MMTLRRTVLLLCFFVASALWSKADTVTVHIADTPIRIPVPQGFYRFDGKSEKVDQVQASVLPATNRLLATFCTDDDLARTLEDTDPRLERSFSVQSVKSLESTPTTVAHFEAIKNAFRTQADRTRDKLGEILSELESSISTNLSKELQSRIDVKMGDMILLGVDDETPESICISMLTKSRITSANLATTGDRVSIQTASAVHILNRVVFLCCTSDYRNKEDIEWARRSVKSWRDEIIAANRLPTAITTPVSHTGPGQSSAKNEFLVGGLIGASIYGIARLLISFKRRL